MSNESKTTAESILSESILQTLQCPNFQKEPLIDVNIDDALALALRYVVAFMHSFPKQDRLRPMLIWNRSPPHQQNMSTSEEFARDLIHNNAKIGLIPHNDKDEWSVDNINYVTSCLSKHFQLSEITMQNGMGSVTLKLWDTLTEKKQLLSGQIIVKFLKKVAQKKTDTNLLDNERLTINVKKCVRAKLFTFLFLRPGRLLSISRFEKPKKPKRPIGRPRSSFPIESHNIQTEKK
jgi:hypothetical protein